MIDEPTKNPRGIQPNTDPDLGELEFRANRSLVESLGDVTDDIRQLYTDFGLRPYTVHVVRQRWTGGQIGRGEVQVVFDQPLLPSPEVVGIASIERTSTNAGRINRGDVTLYKVSPRYTEDQITRYFSTELRDDEEGFIEIRIDNRDGQTERKRYVVVGTPERRPGRFEWVVRLRKQDRNRSRVI